MAAIVCVWVVIIAGLSAGYHKYQQNEISKKAFIANTAVVSALFLIGALLLIGLK